MLIEATRAALKVRRVLGPLGSGPSTRSPQHSHVQCRAGAILKIKRLRFGTFLAAFGGKERPQMHGSRPAGAVTAHARARAM